jgi:membrane protein implicated in regulation of membrane protease activity
MKTRALAAPVPSLGHRAATLASWALPGTVLALLPKCPACLAAYAALWTGIGLSIPVASGLRWALMLACVASLSVLAFRLVRRACHCQRNSCSQEAVLIAGRAVTTGTAGKSEACNHC